MIYFDNKWTKRDIVQLAKTRSLVGFHNGINSDWNRAYMSYCTYVYYPTATCIIFTRDTGMHTCGWWKNPDYERCLHLSLSFRQLLTGKFMPFDKKSAAEWVELFYGDNKNLVWCEPPFSPEGKIADVWHYRIFCDPAWSPMLPRKEVYTKEFTEKGWKSWSEVNAEPPNIPQ